MHIEPFNGTQYLRKGYHLIWQPNIKRFVLIPLLINLVLLATATFYAFDIISDWYTNLPLWLETHTNSQVWYISWSAAAVNWLVTSLDWLLWPLIVISVLVSVFFMFGFLANWIAAPFNGLLSEAVECHLAGDKNAIENLSLMDSLKDIPRLIGREWRKLTYYIPRALLCLLLFVTPVSVLAPAVWFLFNGWMSALQYIDYPNDNHRRPFRATLSNIKAHRSGPFGFGLFVMFLTMIPLVNLLVMPVAVAGATNLWFDHYRNK
ncbi:MAG: sulfate transporter CysZ [Kangiellaceae bacterium]